MFWFHDRAAEGHFTAALKVFSKSSKTLLTAWVKKKKVFCVLHDKKDFSQDSQDIYVGQKEQ